MTDKTKIPGKAGAVEPTEEELSAKELEGVVGGAVLNSQTEMTHSTARAAEGRGRTVVRL